jgi:hypothetical protein
MTFDINPALPKGQRVGNFQVLQPDGSYRPLDLNAT